MERILLYLTALSFGVLQNISLWFVGGSLSFVMGTFLGCLSHRHIHSLFLKIPIRIYVCIARSIPLYIHLLCIYFVIPNLTGINLPPYGAALVAILVCVTAYTTETIRSGINAIANGQWEAAEVIGYSRIQTLRYIILPQAIQMVFPLLGNMSEELIKSTTIVSAIGVMDITRTGMNIIARDMNPELIYGLIAGIYICISLITNTLIHFIQKRMRYEHY
jgi:His/Glu/Gln/Arg/opine family amino acid ABC transporter permease subunit